MKIYVNPITFECHTTNLDGTFLEYEDRFFDNKCASFIEAHRCVPSGYTWKRDDGEIFTGEMITPFKDRSEYEDEQREYERVLLADAENALAILLGGDVT